MRLAALRALAVCSLALWLGCPPEPPDNGIDTQSDDDDDSEADDDSYGIAAQPWIVVDTPPRASFHDAGSTVKVSGTCHEGDAPLDTLTINGVDVPLGGNGSFSLELSSPSHGINILDLELFDTDGERAVEAQSFHYGPTHEPGADLHSIAVIVISPELLDDDNPDLDDTASLVEELLEDPSTFQGLPSVGYSYFDLTLNELSLASADVDLTPRIGVLEVSVVLSDVYASFDAQGVDFWDWVEVSGEAWVDQASFEMDLGVSAGGGGADVTVQSVDVSLQGLSMTVDYVPDFLEGYLSDYLQDYIEDEIRETAETMVADFIEEFLDSFAMDFQFSETIPVSIAVSMSSIAVGMSGLTFWVDGSASAPAMFELPNRAGSLITTGSPPSVPFSSSPLSVAIDDDFVNQLLLALWMANGTVWTFLPEELTQMGAEEIPPPIGPVESVDVAIQLPMVMTESTAAGFDFHTGVGEVWSDLTRTDGEHVGYSTNIGAAASVLEGADGSLGMVMQDQASEVDVAIGVLECPEGQVPSNMAALAEMIVPPMLSQANAGLEGFVLPSVELSTLADIDFFAGKEIRLSHPQVGTAGGEGLWFLLEGGLEVE